MVAASSVAVKCSRHTAGLCFAAPCWPEIARGGGGPKTRLWGIGHGVAEINCLRRPRFAETEEMGESELRSRRSGDQACRVVRVGTGGGLLCVEFSASRIVLLTARLLDAGSRLVAAQSFALASVRRAVKKMVVALFVAFMCMVFSVPCDARTYSAGELLSLASIENPMIMAAPHLLPLPVHLHGDAEHPRAGVLDQGQGQGAATAVGVRFEALEQRLEEPSASTGQQPQQQSPSSRAKANIDEHFSHFVHAERERGEEGWAETQQEEPQGCSPIMTLPRSTHRSSSTLQAATGVPLDR